MKMETRCFLRVTFLGSLLTVSTSYMNEGDSINFVPEEHENWDNLNHRSCGFSMRQRIIGGNTVPLGTYPWLVRVGKERPTDGVLTFPCGGAILNRFYVLTAAHCFRDQKSLPTLVRIGEYDVSSTTDCFQGFCAPPVQDIPIHWYFIPKHFSVEYMENDIALIELKRPIHFSETVQPICMPPYSISSSNLTGKVGEVAGWGLNDIHLRTTPTVMNAVSLKIVENEWCDKYKYRQSNFPFNIICAGGEPGHDSCSGDSGGPLMVPLTAEGYSRYYIIGVVSYGPQACGETDKPGVYTYIPQFQSWILNYITKK